MELIDPLFILVYSGSDTWSTDQKSVHPISCEFAYGEDENDFEATFRTSDVFPYASTTIPTYFFVDGTEYGGVVDAVELSGSSEADGICTLTGRTWQGLLASKVLRPSSTSETAFIYSGYLSDGIFKILSDIDLSLFTSSAIGRKHVDVEIPRYTNAYDALVNMAGSVGRRIVFKGTAAKPTLRADEDQAQQTFVSNCTVKSIINEARYLVCLGSGEGITRTIVILKGTRKSDGTIIITQAALPSSTNTSWRDSVNVYDYPNAESKDELIFYGKKRLAEIMGASPYEISNVADLPESAEIGDLVIPWAYHSTAWLDLDAAQNIAFTIMKKIVKFDINGVKSVQFSVGKKKEEAGYI